MVTVNILNCAYGTGDLQVARTSNENRSSRPKGPPSKIIGAIMAGIKQR